MSWLFKTTVYWMAAFPLARLLQDLATYWEVAPRAGLFAPRELFPYMGSPSGLLGFLVYQAILGTAFGIVFTFLYRRLQPRRR